MIQSEKSKASYVGNNSTIAPYVVDFKFIQNSDITVQVLDSLGVVTTLADSVDYVLIGAGDDVGGSFLTTAAYDNTNTITAFRKELFVQLTDYTPNDKFPAETHESALDKLTTMVQENRRGISRALRVTETSDTPLEAQINGEVNLFYGIDAAGAYTFLTPAEALSILETGGSVINKPTANWSNDAARALKVPDFDGQVGTQSDTSVLYISNGITAGDWGLAAVQVANNSIGNLQMADNAVGLAELEHSYGNDQLIGTNGLGVPVAKADANYLNAAQVNAAEKLAKTETAIRLYSPKDVADIGGVIGEVIYGAWITAPVGYLKADNTAENRVTYADLFAAITFVDVTVDTTSASTTATMDDTSTLEVGYVIEGVGIPVGTTIASITNATTFELSVNATATNTDIAATFLPHGGGDGSTTFNKPDMRGRFARGWDDGAGVDSGRALGSVQADDIKSHTHDLSVKVGVFGAGGAAQTVFNAAGSTQTTVATGGAETRPKNIALLACIKY